MRAARRGRTPRFSRPERDELIPALRRYLLELDVLPRFAVERRFGLYDGDEWGFDRIARSLICTSEAAAGLVAAAINDLRQRMDADDRERPHPTDR